ncbi:hypothetical protein Metho_0679 [Methanomethylovorans hollandica DSM 15978]|uniref:Uncharacterized protein n=1 Tax=Methanomethylovorans hollandica (strain DSM 15978 / NBRC 107637 / DMS1) TaxID=867904 RepID=L0KW68_METHD|nr:hypothetical protein Metho_0679 [Methanomethylovorans hollandica DSM 15978]
MPIAVSNLAGNGDSVIDMLVIAVLIIAFLYFLFLFCGF